MQIDEIKELLGESAGLLEPVSLPISQDLLTLPGPDFVARAWGHSDRSSGVQENLTRLFGTGRLAGTGYLSILPVDQGIEHTAGYEFAKVPEMFDPAYILQLAIEGGCSALASTYGVLGNISQAAVDAQFPLIVKLNHNELLTYPNKHDQVMLAQVEQAAGMGAAAVGSTIYFGSAESDRQLQEVAAAFAAAHRAGLVTIAWCYVRNSEFTKDGVSYETAADLTAQANHLAATIGADIVKQKLPTSLDGFRALKFAQHNDEMYALAGDNELSWTRYQVLHGYAGRVGLISSGGSSAQGDFSQDLKAAVKAAVINKRAGGMGLIAGRKAFSHPLPKAVEILHAIQGVYLCGEVAIC
jgi:class I fructose-bisphosphate aldolase